MKSKKIVISRVILLIAVLCVLLIMSWKYHHAQITHADQTQRFQHAITLTEQQTAESTQQAITLFTTLAKEGHAAAQYRLADLLFEHDKDTAMHWLTHLAEHKNPQGLERLGLIQLENGHIEEGYANVRQAATLQHANSQLYLALCFDMGDCGFSPDETLAIYWAQQAKRNDEPAAQLLLDKYSNQIAESKHHIDEPTKHRALMATLK